LSNFVTGPCFCPEALFCPRLPGFHVEKSKAKDGAMLSLSHVNDQGSG
jgi:hypothetical protein